MLAVLFLVDCKVVSISFLRLSLGSAALFARARFASRCLVFLAMTSFRLAFASFAGSKSASSGETHSDNVRLEEERNSPALAGTSVNHWSSSSLFFPCLPHLFTQSCFSSSQIFLSFTECWIPLAEANLSHFVCGFGFGSGFARGRSYVGAGSFATGPSGEDCIGREKRAARRAWIPSRAVDCRCSSRVALRKLWVKIRRNE